MRRWSRRASLFAVAGTVVFASAVGLFGHRVGTAMIVEPVRPVRHVGPVPADARAVEVETDGARIRAWIFEPGQEAARGTIFLLHGIGDSKRSQVPMARRLASRGFRAVAVDLRCHGESTGQWLSYGLNEARDVRALADTLAGQGLLAEPVGTLGTSYGAATAIHLAAIDARVGATVAIAPFASLREVVPAYVQWVMGPLAAAVPSAYLTRVINDAAGAAQFDADEACPRCVAARVQTPLLLIHSRDDERTPFAHSEAIRDACTAAEVQLMALEGASHNATAGAAGVAEAVEAWFRRHLEVEDVRRP
jgi:uncharacterized protein